MLLASWSSLSLLYFTDRLVLMFTPTYSASSFARSFHHVHSFLNMALPGCSSSHATYGNNCSYLASEYKILPPSLYCSQSECLGSSLLCVHEPTSVVVSPTKSPSFQQRTTTELPTDAGDFLTGMFLIVLVNDVSSRPAYERDSWNRFSGMSTVTCSRV